MIIPTSFKLHGQEIRVVYVPDLLFREEAYGYAKYYENLIELQPDTEITPVPQTQLEESYMHEMVHHILDHVGGKYIDLKSDEEFVERFSKLLHQALTTQQGYLVYEPQQDNSTGGERSPERP